MTKDDAWNGLLDAGETIVWQGRPDTDFALPGPGKIFELIFGLAFAGFALFWMIMAAQAGGGFWAFGLPHFSVGVGIIFHAIGWDRFRRQRTWYTLTDRRAFIATDLPLMGKRLKSYPITSEMSLELVDAPLPSVYFASETRRTKNGTLTVRHGFERIADGRDVYRRIRDIQAKAVEGSNSA